MAVKLVPNSARFYVKASNSLSSNFSRFQSSSAHHDKNNNNTYDVAIVGGGIVGLATAQELIHRYPEMKFVLLEKEPELSQHQSGHNSGVIHAGIYYKPGSLMAKLCVEGLHSTYKYCDKHSIPYKKCGKLVVATNEVEVKRLNDLFERAKQNEVPDVQLVETPLGIAEIEPECKGLKAIWSPHTGIVDWAQVAKQYGTVFVEKGGKIKLNFEVSNFQNSNRPDFPIRITDKNSNEILCKFALTCAGLYSDRIAVLTGCEAEPKIVPFRGEYLLLCDEKSKKIKGNIYPVPDPSLPFLGVHFTPRLNGEIWLGPNAVLAFQREGYKWSDFDLRDFREVLRYPGFIRLVSKYLNFGLMEALRSAFLSLTVKELCKYVPHIRATDIKRGPSGVRAQAINVNGELVADFIFDSPPKSSDLCGRILHCRNAPSPGATSSLAIGRIMADKMAEEFDFPKRKLATLY